MGKLVLKSPAFKNNSLMPSKYTCQGEEVNPPLEISGVPKKAKSLVLTMVDVDTPIKIAFTHWVVCNLKTNTKKIKENDALTEAIIAKNSLRRNRYLGPCPPWGTHRYIFTLYALDREFSFTEKDRKRTILKAIKDNIIEQTELIGLYQRQKQEK